MGREYLIDHVKWHVPSGYSRYVAHATRFLRTRSVRSGLRVSSRHVVYNIPYRRAPQLACWPVQPLGRVRRARKGFLHTSRHVQPTLICIYSTVFFVAIVL